MADTRKLAAWAAGPATFERHLREADVETELSDLEYGRRWAAMMGRSPLRRRASGWGWYTCTDGCEKKSAEVPPELNDHFGDPYFGYKWFDSEAAAYAALGAAVRRIHAVVPPLTGG